jgi:predicted CxxxxCH...CXXCH cytochrome family protein
MPQIKPTHLLVSLAMALALAGCGDKNGKAVLSLESGHPSDWLLTHKTSTRADAGSCVECHGENYDGGISRVSCTSATAVSGFTCHATSPVVNPTGCVSCHGGLPNGPFGTVAPNRKSAHTKHTALVGCDTCHLNAGSGTPGHAKADAAGGRSGATVKLSPVFNANAVSATFDNTVKTCSNVSCHGGKVTPVWTTGSINIVAGVNGDNSVCLQCHEPATTAGIPNSPQYNSFYSGLHVFHLARIVNGFNINCTDCHNIGTLTNFQQHFGGITTGTFTAPGTTIGVGLPTKIGNYDANTKTCSNTVAGCHALNHPGQWITAP